MNDTAVTEFRAMDSEIVVILPVGQRALAGTVRELFELWEARLSRFRAESDLSRLNASAGGTVETREPLTGVLRQALRAAHATDGIFDPTFGRELAAAGYARSFDALDGTTAARPPRRLGGWRSVRIGPLGGVFVPPGLCIDLGGIAKGMAVDAALAELRAQRVEFALVSAGGDLAVAGSPPDGRPWPIAVTAAQGQQTVTLTRGALATSSTEKRRWQTPAGPMHHLLDPRTGLPADTDLVRATVHAFTCEAAEVAAKTALILGLDEGRRFLERHCLTGLLTTAAGSHPVGDWPLPEVRAA